MTEHWILAFDTATRATAVALGGPGDEVLEARDDPPPGQRPNHAAKLLPLCADLLGQAELAWAQLARLAVGIGPGTFTGLRIGVATARALAWASHVPLIGVSTLRSLALNASSVACWPETEAVVAVLDARRGEAFAAGWQTSELDALAPAALGPAAVGPQALGDAVGRLGPAVLALGEGAIAFRGVLERSGAFVPDDDSELHRVRAVNHCRIARVLEPSDPERVQPEYLRLPDAELARRAAGKQ
jgi:tRNA threonylcarbamoyladenosine biosynthesis protein TsaB